MFHHFLCFGLFNSHVGDVYISIFAQIFIHSYIYLYFLMQCFRCFIVFWFGFWLFFFNQNVQLSEIATKIYKLTIMQFETDLNVRNVNACVWIDIKWELNLLLTLFFTGSVDSFGSIFVDSLFTRRRISCEAALNETMCGEEWDMIPGYRFFCHWWIWNSFSSFFSSFFNTKKSCFLRDFFLVCFFEMDLESICRI